MLLRGVLRCKARLGWLLLGTSLLSTTAGNLAYILAGFDITPVPSPNVVDVLWLAAYPLQAAGVIAIARADVIRCRGSTALDALVAALGAAALTALVFGPVMATATGGRAEVLTLLAYPAGDLLTLTICLGALAALGWPLRGPWGYLGLSFLLSAGPDIVYLLLAAKGTYADGTLLDVFWPVSALVGAVAAWRAPAVTPVRTGLRHAQRRLDALGDNARFLRPPRFPPPTPLRNRHIGRTRPVRRRNAGGGEERGTVIAKSPARRTTTAAWTACSTVSAVRVRVRRRPRCRWPWRTSTRRGQDADPGR